ncbi:MAG: hypothetical protein HC880_10140 [Bacteroidia bacterium]|nr:hypothetical protein [Bacteroidia bacterium]
MNPNFYCYLNGRYMPLGEASIALNDLGLLRACGVFDYLRTYEGHPFKLKSHLQRLAHSAAFVNLALPHSLEEIAAIIEDLLYLRPDKSQDVALRLVLTGGLSEDGTRPRTAQLFYHYRRIATNSGVVLHPGRKGAAL